MSSFDNFLKNYRPNTGEMYFKFFYSSSPFPWYHSLYSNRKSITTFCRMRSNHYNLAFSLYRKNLTNSPISSCQKDIEDLNHIFWACNLFSEQRKTLYKQLFKLRRFPHIISEFLFSPSATFINPIFRFLEECNISIWACFFPCFISSYS